MDFGQALDYLRSGSRVAREGWNGKNMWLALSPGKPNHLASDFWSPAVREWAKDVGFPSIPVEPYIVMYTAQGTIVPWLASQTDILAEDWGEVIYVS